MASTKLLKPQVSCFHAALLLIVIPATTFDAYAAASGPVQTSQSESIASGSPPRPSDPPSTAREPVSRPGESTSKIRRVPASPPSIRSPHDRGQKLRIRKPREGRSDSHTSLDSRPADAPTGDTCTAPEPSLPVPFGVGETLEFEVDSMGARIGTFTTHIAPGRGETPWTIVARAKTHTFVANFHEVSARARAGLGSKLESRTYEEDSTEGGVHRTVDISLPVPENGALPVRSTRDGTPRQFQLRAPRQTRDLLSALHVARAMPLKEGDTICLPIFAAHRMWTLRMRVMGKEPIHTPVGRFDSLHLEGTAFLQNNPKRQREVHLWFSDDEARIPLAAFGLIQGKPVRAQLVQYEPGKRRNSGSQRSR